MTLREMLLHVKDNHGVEISVYQTPTVIFKGDASAALSEDGLRRWKNHEVQSVYANGSALRNGDVLVVKGLRGEDRCVNFMEGTAVIKRDAYKNVTVFLGALRSGNDVRMATAKDIDADYRREVAYAKKIRDMRLAHLRKTKEREPFMKEPKVTMVKLNLGKKEEKQ